MTNKQLVNNASKGYGYSYASLADIAAQGFTIPKMKTGTENGKEYVFWKEGDEWLRGAEIVLIEAKGMNSAQIYGSALTYARRYTTLMALSLACDDDVAVENTSKDGTPKGQPKIVDTGEPITPKQLEIIEGLSIAQIANILKHYGVERTKDLTKAMASETISKLRGK